MADTNKISTIQGMRGIAAGLVLVHHLTHSAPRFGFEQVNPWLEQFGSAGVDVFFLISGFLIASILRGTDDTRSFLLRRVIRVVPLLLVTNCVTVMFNVRLGVMPDPWTVLSSCLMLPGMLQLPIIQPHAWSLSYEFAFYTSAAVFAASWRRSPWWAAVAGLLWLAVAVPPNPRFLYMVVGGVVAFHRVHWTLPSLPLVLLFAALVSGMLVQHGMFSSLAQVPVWLYVTSLPVGYLTLCSVLKPDRVSRSVLESWPLQQLGLVSYSFYMWQNLVIWSYKQWWPDVGGVVQLALFTVVVVTTVTVFSWLSYRTIEEDSARFLRRRLLAPSRHHA